jgi:hypothetical protein
MKPTLELLDAEDWKELEILRQAADMIVQRIRPDCQLTRQLRDLGTLQAIIDDPDGRAAIRKSPGEFGVAFGDLLLALEKASSTKLPLEWCVANDEYGRRFAIKHRDFDAFISLRFALENMVLGSGCGILVALFTREEST